MFLCGSNQCERVSEEEDFIRYETQTNWANMFCGGKYRAGSFPFFVCVFQCSRARMILIGIWAGCIYLSCCLLLLRGYLMREFFWKKKWLYAGCSVKIWDKLLDYLLMIFKYLLSFTDDLMMIFIWPVKTF